MTEQLQMLCIRAAYPGGGMRAERQALWMNTLKSMRNWQTTSTGFLKDIRGLRQE
jgi:hypothetical protein